MLRGFKIFLVVVMVHTYVSLHNFDESSCNITSAFVVKSWYRSYRCHPTSTALYQTDMFQHFPGSDVIVDHDRAQYCVDHFGTCAIAEMESLKNGM